MKGNKGKKPPGKPPGKPTKKPSAQSARLLPKQTAPRRVVGQVISARLLKALEAVKKAGEANLTLVPRDATVFMCDAGAVAGDVPSLVAGRIWHAMLAAAAEEHHLIEHDPSLALLTAGNETKN